MWSIGGNVALVSDYISPGKFGAVCMDCVPIIPQEFDTSEQRDDWVNRHRVCGHQEIMLVDGRQ